MIQARNRRRLPLVMPATVHIRRSYAECRFGQLHVATAYPSGGGFDERTALICLHPNGSSARFFGPVLPELGRDRSLYAIDLPGHGYSDGPDGAISIADFAAAVGEFIDSLRLRAVDVVGCQLGALIAIELALLKPQQVRRLVLSSVPQYTLAERQAMESKIAPAMPSNDGSHLSKDWQQLQKSRGPTMTPDVLTDDLADYLRSRRRVAAGFSAMLDHPSAKRLQLVRQPGLLLRTGDEYWEHTLRAKQAYPQGLMEELPECGSGLFAGGNHHAVQLIRQFFDR